MGTLLVDGHVHLYDCYDRERFWAGAARNFERARQVTGFEDATAVLCFTEDARYDTFREMRDGGGDDLLTITRTAESESILVLFQETEFLVLGGRQMVTSEGLEVLALATDSRIGDQQDLGATLDQVVSAGGVPVVPWALGKWWFGRGRVLKQELSSRTRRFCLGDNRGRPSILGIPGPLRSAKRDGIPVLPGTDPLPFQEHEGALGKYGFVLEGPLDRTRPAESFRTSILALETSPRSFGSRVGTAGMCVDQIRLRRGQRG